MKQFSNTPLQAKLTSVFGNKKLGGGCGWNEAYFISCGFEVLEGLCEVQGLELGVVEAVRERDIFLQLTADCQGFGLEECPVDLSCL